jgi:hypothetical protein
MIGKWIKPKDRLPEEDKMILFWVRKESDDDSDFVACGCYSPKTNNRYNIGNWYAGDFDYDDDLIEGWMELPEMKHSS